MFIRCHYFLKIRYIQINQHDIPKNHTMYLEKQFPSMVNFKNYNSVEIYQLYFKLNIIKDIVYIKYLQLIQYNSV